MSAIFSPPSLLLRARPLTGAATTALRGPAATTLAAAVLHSRLLPHHHHHHHQILPLPQRRYLLSSILTRIGEAATGHAAGGRNEETVSARRVLPYATMPLWDIIADVDRYHEFVPHCAVSRVTHWSFSPESSGSGDDARSSSCPTRLPTQADLTVAVPPLFRESFTSRLICVPGVSVEAQSGAEFLDGAGAGAGAGGGGRHSHIFESLVTRWTVEPARAGPARGSSGGGSSEPPPLGPGPGHAADAWTEVNISVRYKFSNPAHALLMAAVGHEMVRQMIEQFEKRADLLLGSKGKRRGY